MAKQFQNIQIDLVLEALLLKSELKVMTEEEMQEQRISFAYGNLSLHDDKVTKESVRRAAESIRLR